MKTAAIIVAAGRGKRMGAPENKVYLPLCKKPVLAYSLEVFAACECIDEIIIAAAPGEEEKAAELARLYAPEKFKTVTTGGDERYDTVKIALSAVSDDVDFVAVHDGARPLVSDALIKRVWQDAQRPGVDGSVPALPVVDTVKMVKHDMVSATLERSGLCRVQTPQIFNREVLDKAYNNLFTNVTDDASCVELIGGKVSTIYGDVRNIKLTVPFDIRMAEFFLDLSGVNEK